MYRTCVFISVPDSIPSDEMEQESDLPSANKKLNIDSGSKPPAKYTTTTTTTTRTPLATFRGHSNAVTAVVWAGQPGSGEGVGPGDDIITAGWDNCLKVWDAGTGVNKSTMVRKGGGAVGVGPGDDIIMAEWQSKQHIMVVCCLFCYADWPQGISVY